jgi:ectoine hydroxylase-related dioxygenase (phytanoyl-CoA dioxygenase family)
MATIAQLPDLDSTFPVPASEIEAFKKNGWAMIRGLCTPDEMAVYGPLIRDVTIAHNNETRPLAERDTYGKAFLQTMNLWRQDEGVAKFTLAHRFASVAAALLDVEKVRLYHDQSLFKEPHGGHTPWHQDGWYWPLQHSKTVTMWMPLVDISAEMGSMSFADGSHLEGIVPVTGAISDQSEAFFEGFVMGRRLTVSTGGAMKAGDATFHSGITLHRAPGNPTDRVRAIMTVIYVADGERVQEPDNDFRKADLANWIPGCKPGDLVNSPLNPVL